MQTKTSLESLIKSHNFSFVNSNITPENFPEEEIRSSEYKLFHFNRFISSEDAIKEIEKEGYSPANIYELLSWPDWNGTDLVIGLGSSCVVGGDRRVPGLGAWDSGRGLCLRWFEDDWRDSFRFLAVRNLGIKTLEPKDEALSPSDPLTLCPHCGKEVKVELTQCDKI